MITGGVVSFEDGLKAAEEYAPPRKVRVELRFDIDPTLDAAGVNATIDAVGEQAKAKVYELLGGTAPKAARAPRKAAEPTAEKPAASGKTKKDLEAEAIANMQGSGKPASDPASMEEFTVGPASGAEVVDESLTVSPAEPVSDAELNTAVQKKNAEIKAPAKIREVIGSFNPDPSKQFTLAQIPQEQRRAFLAKLGALTA